jgi:WD40 repeat protein
VSAADDRRLKRWDVKTGRELQTIERIDDVPVLAYAPDGKRFVGWFLAPGQGNDVVSSARAFDAATGKALESIEDRGRRVRCLSITPDTSMVAMGATDGSVRFWSMKTRERLPGGDLLAHPKGVGDVALTPDGKTLISSDAEGEVKVWDLSKRQAIKTIRVADKQLVGLLAAPDGRRFATMVPREGLIKLWDSTTGQELRSWPLPSPVSNMVFTPDGRSLVVASDDATVLLLELP